MTRISAISFATLSAMLAQIGSALAGSGGPDAGSLGLLTPAIIAGVAAGGGALAYLRYRGKN